MSEFLSYRASKFPSFQVFKGGRKGGSIRGLYLYLYLAYTGYVNKTNTQALIVTVGSIFYPHSTWCNAVFLGRTNLQLIVILKNGLELIM